MTFRNGDCVMLKTVAIAGFVVIVVAMIPASYFGLENYCSLQHHGIIKNSNSPSSGEQDTPPRGMQADPTATFNLSVSEPGKIEGSYYAKGAPQEKEPWTQKFWCDAKIGEFALVVFTFLLVLFTGGLWFSTNRLWAVTNDTLEHAQKASEDELRPYIHVAKAYFDWTGPRVRILVKCVNSGQTPATFFEVGCVAESHKRGDTYSEIPTEMEYSVWSALGAGRSETASVELDASSAPGVAAAVKGSLSGLSFMVLGRVRYGDIFGNKYESEFVYFTRKVDISGPIKMSRATGRFKTYHKTENA